MRSNNPVAHRPFRDDLLSRGLLAAGEAERYVAWIFGQEVTKNYH